MRWLHKLYLAGDLADREEEIRNSFEEKQFGSYYVLLIPSGSVNLLDIRKSRDLALLIRRGENPRIVGIAGDRQEAYLLVQKITEDCLMQRKDVKLREFLENMPDVPGKKEFSGSSGDDVRSGKPGGGIRS